MKGHWTIDDGTTWLNSGDSVRLLKDSDVTIKFSSVNFFTKPSDISMIVNSTSVIDVNYIPIGPASLQFTDHLIIYNTSPIYSGDLYMNPPVFSLNPGYYVNFMFPIQTTITHSVPSLIIYYTLDGSPPTISSNLYVGPVSIPEFEESDPMGTLELVRAIAYESSSGEYSREAQLEIRKGGSYVISYTIPEYLAIDTLVGYDDYIENGSYISVIIPGPSDVKEVKDLELSPSIEGGSFTNVIVKIDGETPVEETLQIECSSGLIEGGRFWNPIIEP